MTEKYYSEMDLVEVINTLPVIAIINGIIERFGPNMTETEREVLIDYANNLRSSIESLVGENLNEDEILEPLSNINDGETLIGEEDKSKLILNEGKNNKDGSKGDKTPIFN